MVKMMPELEDGEISASLDELCFGVLEPRGDGYGVQDDYACGRGHCLRATQGEKLIAGS